MASPTASGTHPPCDILRIFEPKKAISMEKKNRLTIRARGRDHFQTVLIAKKARIVVITIVVVMAIPYAAARLLEDLNSSTRKTIATNSSQLSWGIYIWPRSSFDVWIIRT